MFSALRILAPSLAAALAISGFASTAGKFLLLILAALGVAMLRPSEAGAQRPDFDQDGLTDLVIGAPHEDLNGRVGAISNAGAVHVLYGSCDPQTGACGLSADGDQLWTQDSPDVLGSSGEANVFGTAVAYGDFNGDNFDDLAIGVPGEKVNGEPGAGGVNVLYSAGLSGLTSAGNQFWSAASSGVPTDPEAGAAFGHALAVGRIDDDTFDDLAIGVPLGDPPPNNPVNAGMVIVLYGSPDGLTAGKSKVLSQDTPGVLQTAESGDRFRWALAVADLDCSGGTMDDLVIGVPFETLGTGFGAVVEAGAVNVLFSSRSGPSSSGNQLWTQNSSGVPDAAEAGDHFGWSVAASSTLAGGGLVVGVPEEDVSSRGNPDAVNAGAVNVIYTGCGTGEPPAPQFWSQNSNGIASVAETGDAFGFSLVFVEDLLSGALAIGAPLEDVSTRAGSVQDAGAVHVLLDSGCDPGLCANGSLLLTQAPDQPETSDRFGWALGAASLDYDGQESPDLVVGVPGKVIDGVVGGAVNVIYDPFDAEDFAELWSQNTPGVLGGAEANDDFGKGLTAPVGGF